MSATASPSSHGCGIAVNLHDAPRSVGVMPCAGVAMNWSLVQDQGARRRVPLPTDPCEHPRHWFKPAGETVPQTEHAAECARLPANGRYGLCVVGDHLDDVFAAMSDETEGRRLDGRDDAVLRSTLRALPSGRRWYLVSVVDSRDDAPDALERAVRGMKHVAEAVVEAGPPLAGWRILVRGVADLPGDSALGRISPVATAVTAAARVLRAELKCDVRVIDYLEIPIESDRLLVELVSGEGELVAVRDGRRFVPDECGVITGRIGGLAPDFAV